MGLYKNLSVTYTLSNALMLFGNIDRDQIGHLIETYIN